MERRHVAIEGRGEAALTQGPNIVFTGESDWCSLIVAGLQGYAGADAQVAPFDRAADAASLGRWWRLARADVVVRMGFRPGARTWRGKGLDFAMRFVRALHPGQKTIYYWIGTDVLKLLSDVRSGSAPGWLRRELDSAVHFSVAEPLALELREAGVTAEFMPFPFRNMPEGDGVPPMPNQFTVLSYIPDDRASFYGAPQLLEAARCLPDVRFRILGGSGPVDASVPENVEYLGFHEDASRFFVEASCVVRLTEHDGAGGTILEALSYGRPAIYSRAQADVIHVPFDDVDGLVREISRLRDSSAAGELVANAEVAKRVRATFDSQRCYSHLAERLAEIASTR